MSEDPDFEMEVVEDDELDELGGNSESSSAERDYLDMEETGKSDRSDAEKSVGASVQGPPGRHEERKSRPRNSHGGGEADAQRFGPFTFDLPEDWRAERQRKVKQLFTRGKQPTYADVGVPVINQECIYWDGWHFDNLRFLDREEAEGWPEKYFPKKGDIVLNSTGQGTLGRAQVYPDEKRRAVDSHVTILRTTSELNPYFHRYFLESHLGQALLYSMCVNGSTGQIELSKTRLDLMPVPIPPLPEQRKIASVLYTVDQAIQKTEAIIEQAKRVKRGLMQDVLRHGVDDTGKIRSDVELKQSPRGRIPSHWKAASIGDAARIQVGYTFRSEQFTEEGIPIVRMSDLVDGRLELEDARRVPREVADSNENYLLREGDILVGMSGSIEKFAVASEEDLPCLLNQRVGRFLVDEDLLLTDFLRYLVDTKDYRDQVNRMASGAAQKNISGSQIERIKIPLPPVAEQRRIADILLSLDGRIHEESWMKKRLQRLKRGLMQDLLTGKVRTADKAIKVLDEVVEHG